jgi:hypothetical protein
MNKAKKIARQVKKLSGIDVFKNTRKKEFVEARSLLSTILYKYEKMNLHEIKNFYIENGKSSDHTTVLHSVKNWEIYSQDKSCVYLNDWLECITENLGKANNQAKRESIKLKINFLSNKDVDVLNLLVNEMAKKELEAAY